MKNFLLSAAVFLFVCCGEYKMPEAKIGNGASEVFIVNVKGHDYVIFDGCYKGGIVHAESCPCKQNKK